MSNLYKNKKVIFRCDKCNKFYKTYKTLWEHNKKFHSSNNKPIDKPNISHYKSNDEIENNTYKCRHCNNLYKHFQSRWKHEKVCKDKDKITELTNIKLLELQLKTKEEEILKLKLKLQKSKNVNVSTVNQLNKLLLERHYQYQNYINNYGNLHTGNNIVNNIQIIGFGKEENVVDRLTNGDRKSIIDSRYKCLEKLVETVNCGKYNEFKNILVTNMKDKYMYTYDDDKAQLVLAPKEEVMDTLIVNRIYDLETIYDTFVEENKINNRTKNIIEDLLNKLNEECKYTDSDGNIHETYKHYKINEIKLILFNNKNKITKDISLLLTTTTDDS